MMTMGPMMGRALSGCKLPATAEAWQHLPRIEVDDALLVPLWGVHEHVRDTTGQQLLDRLRVPVGVLADLPVAVHLREGDLGLSAPLDTAWVGIVLQSLARLRLEPPQPGPALRLLAIADDDEVLDEDRQRRGVLSRRACTLREGGAQLLRRGQRRVGDQAVTVLAGQAHALRPGRGDVDGHGLGRWVVQ